MPYKFEKYDVVQIKRGQEWLDFSSLRTEAEGRQAVDLVDRGIWDGQPAEFRICAFKPDKPVKYARKP